MGGRVKAVVLLAAAIAIAASSAMVSEGRWEFAVCVAFVCAFCAALVVTIDRSVITAGRLNRYLLIVWFALTPIASYFVRYPADKSIITFDRVMVCGLGLWLLLEELAAAGYLSRAARSTSVSHSSAASQGVAGRSNSGATWRPAITVTKFEISFALLAAAALVSVATRSIHPAASVRVAVDAMVLPLIVFRLARRWLNGANHFSLVVFAAILLSIFLLVTGAYELSSGINLFPYKGSELLREGELRVNGPFVADTSFALISLLLAVFLFGASRIVANKGSRARMLLTIAAVPAAIAALLPLFRAVALALAVCWALVAGLTTAAREGKRRKDQSAVGDGKVTGSAGIGQTYEARGWRLLGARPIARPILIAAILLALFLGTTLAIGGVSALGRLTSARNLLGRIASQQIAVKIWWTDPLLGVGLGNYSDYFDKEYSAGGRSYLEEALDTRVANTPHSNLFWIASELGAVGLILYIAANIFLFMIGWRALRGATTMRTRAAAACYLAVVIAYWIPGLALQTGFYWDINLYYFFTLGLLSAQFPVTCAEDRQAEPART